MATNEEYAPHAAVVIRSLMQQHQGRAVCFHFVHDQGHVEPRHFGALRRVATDSGADFEAVSAPREWVDRFQHDGLFGLHAWLRLLLPEVLPQLPRVLYLDSDIVVNGSLERLWRIDLQGKMLAAVVNPIYPHKSDAWIGRLGIPDRRFYFNSGVLLLDLSKLRAGGWTERLAAYAEKVGHTLPLPDQDVLNHFLWQHWLPLPPSYNAQASIYDLKRRHLPHDAAELREARARPIIIHFTGVDKPWLDVCRHPWRGLYWQHLRQTPWRARRPLAPRWSNLVLRRLPYPLYRQLVRIFKPRELFRKPPARD